MAAKSKTFSILSFTFTGVGLVALVIAFVSDRWVVSTEKEVSGFKNIGLWSACFSKYRAPAYALVDKYYDGCWWVFNREIDELRSFLFPPWFVGTQALVSVSLSFQLLAIIIMIVNAINCFPYSKHKDNIALGLTAATTLLHGFTAIFLTVAVILFGARADNERTWLERPDQNYLSWSFGMCVLAAFLAILSFMSVAVELHRLRLKYSEAQTFVTAPPPPPSPYSYSNRKFSALSVDRSVDSRVQPAYTNTNISWRHANNGIGEAYVNHAYASDEHRQKGRINGYVPPYVRHQQERQFDDRNRLDSAGISRYPHSGSTLNAVELNNITSRETLYSKNDYEDSKKVNQPTLPEYVPKGQPMNMDKVKIENTLDKSCDSDIKIKKKDLNSSDEQLHKQRQSRSESKDKKSTKKDSFESEGQKKTQKSSKNNDSKLDDGHSRHRSKSQDDSGHSDEEYSYRHHNRKTQSHRRRKSHSRERNSSRHRSRSRDVNSSESDGADSLASRSRKKYRSSKNSSSQEKKHHSVSKDSSRQEKNKHSTSHRKTTSRHHNESDDWSGSEHSHGQKIKTKHNRSQSEGRKKPKSHDFSDTESVHSRQRSKKNGSTRSDAKKRTKSLEYSDTESVGSRRRSRRRTEQTESDDKRRAKSVVSDNESVRGQQTRPADFKPKGTYSSYYE